MKNYLNLSMFSRLACIGAACTVSAFASATVNNTTWPPAVSGSGSLYSFDLAISAADEIVTGDFFRIYDFGGLQGSPVAPTGWTATVSNTDATPPPNVLLSYGDDPAVPNITFTYTGSTPILGDADITGFEAISSQPPDAWTLKDAPARVTSVSLGSFVDSDSVVAVPTAPVATPEPASFVFAGLGLLLGGWRYRRSIAHKQS